MGFRSKRPAQTVTIRCGSCGLEVLLRGGDHAGWKGVQKQPNDADSFVWYCPNESCREAFHTAVGEARVAWGVGVNGNASAVADEEEL